MKHHTRMLAVLAEDLATLNIDAISIRIAPYSGLSWDDFDELKKIMAARHPMIRLHMI